jgi:hypothetical protein
LIPQLQVAAVRFTPPILVQIDEDVNAAFKPQGRVEIEVGMDVQMTTMAHLVEAAPAK